METNIAFVAVRLASYVNPSVACAKPVGGDKDPKDKPLQTMCSKGRKSDNKLASYRAGPMVQNVQMVAVSNRSGSSEPATCLKGKSKKWLCHHPTLVNSNRDEESSKMVVYY